jgi:hypothetical protein
MAKFSGSKSSGNRGGGFYTNNPNATFKDCVAEDNTGPGFVDESGGRVAETGGFRRFIRDTGAGTIAAIVGGLIVLIIGAYLFGTRR